MSVAVEFNHVSKYFVLQKERPNSIQEAFLSFFQRRRYTREELWVLRDVSFQLEQGKMVGFIGVNGAGKSTVLKLMTRILQPTNGWVKLNGRVSALLELGAGFHPDLSGRENIYMNGSIMGLHREEIDRKLEAIVAFAELEQFVDMPVKHYSSGMYMRLGFSVAVHANPELLLVDEVLAVGDAAFQSKCMDRIFELRRKGVTIVLVSHSTNVVQSLCDEAIWIDEGRIRAQGAALDVTMAYMESVADKQELAYRQQAEQEPDDETSMTLTEGEAVETGGRAAHLDPRHRWGNQMVQLSPVQLYNQQGECGATFETGDLMRIDIPYYAPERVEKPVFGLAIYHQNGAHICGPNTQFNDVTIPLVEGHGTISYTIPVLNLLEGAYLISTAVVNENQTVIYDYHDRLYSFHVFRGKCRELYGLVTFNGSWDSWANSSVRGEELPVREGG